LGDFFWGIFEKNRETWKSRPKNLQEI